MKTVSRALLLILLLLFPKGSMAAEPPPPLPPGMTQLQFDQLVESIARAVAKKLDDEGVTSSKANKNADDKAKPSSALAEDQATDPTSVRVTAFVSRAEAVLSAYPALRSNFARIPVLLDQSPRGGRSLWGFLALLTSVAIAAVGSEVLLRVALGRWRERLQRDAARSVPLAHRWPPLLALIGIDALALGAVWLVSYVAIGIWFPETDGQGKFAAGILTAIFAWRLYVGAFRIVLRPDLPLARIAQISDADAALVYRCVSIVSFFVFCMRIVHRVLTAIGTPLESIAAGQLPGTALELAIFVGAAYASRDAVRAWFSGIAGQSRLGRVMATRWLSIAIPFFTALALTQIYSAISLQIEVPTALLLTFNVIVGLIFFETLVAYFMRHTARDGNETAPAETAAPPRHAISRCLRVAVLILAAGIIAQTWIVDVLAILEPSGWRSLTHSSIVAGSTLFVAFVAWETVEFIARRHAAPASAIGPDGQARGEAEPEATRLATIMPVLRVTLLILIGLVALLVVLSELGVNIAPILAGASVFGLAISFGSQTLVRDVVSGIFYLADDAFRVGEYIDCGKAKGTVESFTMRSVRLRHQNGPVHTIPFGQLGQITNFSRDWSTVKFALRFMGNTDLEKLRKIVKAIGIEMMEDPDLKGEILEPLKMMGVVDIADSALVVRFKFTARPGNPTIIQRNAMKRMVRAFQDAGIVFGNAFVAVQTVGGPTEPSVGAAASLAIAKQKAEAAALGS